MRNNLCLFVTAAALDATEDFAPVESVGAGYRILVVAASEFVRRRSSHELTRAGFAVTATDFDDKNEAAGHSPAAFDAVIVEPEGNVVDAALEALWVQG